MIEWIIDDADMRDVYLDRITCRLFEIHHNKMAYSVRDIRVI